MENWCQPHIVSLSSKFEALQFVHPSSAPEQAGLLPQTRLRKNHLFLIASESHLQLLVPFEHFLLCWRISVVFLKGAWKHTVTCNDPCVTKADLILIDPQVQHSPQNQPFASLQIMKKGLHAWKGLFGWEGLFPKTILRFPKRTVAQRNDWVVDY